ncbi:MAG TPA: chromate transporter [Methylibium sp.]|nr:chromate transporter [Methylibium sp.]HEU4457733.1 chromate transporter [Methylibium sp.]
MVGHRYFGLRGALAALAGMLSAPLAVVMAVTLLYAPFADEPPVAGALRGMGAAAAGMIGGIALKLANSLRGSALGPWALAALAGASYGAIALLRWTRRGAAGAGARGRHAGMVAAAPPTAGRRVMTMPPLDVLGPMFGHLLLLSLLSIGGAISSTRDAPPDGRGRQVDRRHAVRLGHGDRAGRTGSQPSACARSSSAWRRSRWRWSPPPASCSQRRSTGAAACRTAVRAGLVAHATASAGADRRRRTARHAWLGVNETTLHAGSGDTSKPFLRRPLDRGMAPSHKAPTMAARRLEAVVRDDTGRASGPWRAPARHQQEHQQAAPAAPIAPQGLRFQAAAASGCAGSLVTITWSILWLSTSSTSKR